MRVTVIKGEERLHVIHARNVNDAYHQGVEYLREYGVHSSSRAGDVLVAPGPVTTVYLNPRERVLWDPARDANPFFHLFEALWMLAGRQDCSWLNQFVRDYSERFAEPGGVMHDAYGWRWRHGLGFDQLYEVVKKLRRQPNDRQCVLQMWDARETSLDTVPKLRIGANDLQGDWKTRPCNTHIYLQVKGSPATLEMTVCCRSNDIIWGAYGANVVHFSFLQEYLAAQIGVEVGTYYQMSNNYHVYTEVLDKLSLKYVTEPGLENLGTAGDPYMFKNLWTEPLVTKPITFDADLTQFMVWSEQFQITDDPLVDAFHQLRETDPTRQLLKTLDNKWLACTAVPLFVVAKLWRRGERQLAFTSLENAPFVAPDWRLAALAWMRRRMAKKAAEVPV